MPSTNLLHAQPQHSVARRRVGWIWVVLSSVGIASYFVGQYMTDTLENLSKDQVGLSSTYANHGPVYLVAFYVHIAFAGVALLIGPFQFAARLRTRHPQVHRVTGRIYLSSVALAAPAGLIMATINMAGISGFLGYGSLAVLWAFVSWKGYRAIRTRDIASHRAWMMRSFALTYAAVTLRLWLGVFIGIQIPFTPAPFDFDAVFNNAYAPVPWISWIPNIVIAEFLIRARSLPSLHITDADHG